MLRVVVVAIVIVVEAGLRLSAIPISPAIHALDTGERIDGNESVTTTQKWRTTTEEKEGCPWESSECDEYGDWESEKESIETLFAVSLVVIVGIPLCCCITFCIFCCCYCKYRHGGISSCDGMATSQSAPNHSVSNPNHIFGGQHQVWIPYEQPPPSYDELYPSKPESSEPD